MKDDYTQYAIFLVNEVIDKTESGKRLVFDSVFKKLTEEGDYQAYMRIVCSGKRPLYTRDDVYKDEKGHWYKK